jgi:hypothetical protein
MPSFHTWCQPFTVSSVPLLSLPTKVFRIFSVCSHYGSNTVLLRMWKLLCVKDSTQSASTLGYRFVSSQHYILHIHLFLYAAAFIYFKLQFRLFHKLLLVFTPLYSLFAVLHKNCSQVWARSTHKLLSTHSQSPQSLRVHRVSQPRALSWTKCANTAQRSWTKRSW